MKNQYMKPVLLIESFTLSQSIAAGCGQNLDFSQATSQDVNTCVWQTGFPNENVFVKGVNENCNISDEEFDGVCYHNPEGGFNVFSS